jgi:hypothetical protein
MHHFSIYRLQTNHLTESRIIGISIRRIFSLTLGIFVVTLIHIASAQPKVPPARDSSLCSRENAVETVRQQIDFTKSFDNTTHRIAVLIRAADLLWTYEPEKGRAAFAEALELARQNFKQKGDKPRGEGFGLRVDTPDQRYTVISAIARRDPAWAKKLTEQMLKEEAKEAEDKPASDREQAIRTAEKLLTSGYSLLPTDLAAAVNFATASLHYPASLYLTIFLYKLAEVDRTAADQFYQQALAAYADKSMNEFLYLSAYPFGNNRDAGEMPGYTIYGVPPGFVPNQSIAAVVHSNSPGPGTNASRGTCRDGQERPRF